MTNELYTCDLLEVGNEITITHYQHCNGFETRVGEDKFRNERDFVDDKSIIRKIN